MTTARGEDGSSLSIEIQGRIDRICLDFEDQWRAGKAPRMEDFLGSTTGTEREALFLELLRLDLDYRPDRDADRCYADYRARFPHDEAWLQQLLDPPDEPPIRVFAPREQVGQFEIESKLGEGAFGVVYGAIDRDTGKRVALKVPHPRVLRRAGGRQHLEEEAQTLSRLNHPAIVAFREIIRDDHGGPILVDYTVSDGTTSDTGHASAARTCRASNCRCGIPRRESVSGIPPPNLLFGLLGFPTAR